MTTLAEKTARQLERERVKTLGAASTFVLRSKSGSALLTIASSFVVVRKVSVALGEEFLEAEISELAKVAEEGLALTQSIIDRSVTAKLSTLPSELKIGVVENPLTGARTWKIRLTPIVRNG